MCAPKWDRDIASTLPAFASESVGKRPRQCEIIVCGYIIWKSVEIIPIGE